MLLWSNPAALFGYVRREIYRLIAKEINPNGSFSDRREAKGVKCKFLKVGAGFG